jgi:hypothetical protein
MKMSRGFDPRLFCARLDSTVAVNQGFFTGSMNENIKAEKRPTTEIVDLYQTDRRGY